MCLRVLVGLFVCPTFGHFVFVSSNKHDVCPVKPVNCRFCCHYHVCVDELLVGLFLCRYQQCCCPVVLVFVGLYVSLLPFCFSVLYNYKTSFPCQGKFV